MHPAFSFFSLLTMLVYHALHSQTGFLSRRLNNTSENEVGVHHIRGALGLLLVYAFVV